MHVMVVMHAAITRARSASEGSSKADMGSDRFLLVIKKPFLERLASKLLTRSHHAGISLGVTGEIVRYMSAKMLSTSPSRTLSPAFATSTQP